MAAASPSTADAVAPPPWFGRGTASALDRLPVFEAAMANTSEAWASSFASLSSTPAEMIFTGLSTSKVDALQGRKPGSTFAIMQAPLWNTTVALQFDRSFISTVVEALFGGEDGDDDVASNRPLSALEWHIAEVVGAQITDALVAGFAPHAAAGFVFDRLLPKPDLTVLGKPNAGVVIATLALRTLGRTVECDLLVPVVALTALGDQFASIPAAAGPIADPRWSERLGLEVGRTTMHLQATIEGAPMSLGAVAALSAGQVLPLPVGAGRRVVLSCADASLFQCDLGQSDGFYTLRIHDALDPGKGSSGPNPSSAATDHDRPASP